MSNPSVFRGRLASSSPREFDYANFIYQNEGNYPMMTTARRIFGWVYSLPEHEVWNSTVSFMALFSIIIVSMDFKLEYIVLDLDIMTWIDCVYNAQYALHVGAHIYYDIYRIQRQELLLHNTLILMYILDALSFLHYFSLLIENTLYVYIIKMICYSMRLIRPLTFLVGLMENNLKGDVLGSLLKYFYIFTLIRVFYVNFFIWIGMSNFSGARYTDPPPWLARSNRTRDFFKGFYVVNKLFLSMGTDYAPKSITQQLAAMSLMTSGCLIVTGITVASMSLIMGVFMRGEEIFRSRFRIILNDMNRTNVPKPLREKVETFYRMYWHKQKAVSTTHLIPLFPPTLKQAINTDIYFEAQQRSRILCDLSYQFLAEIAKFMQIIHYVPGDTIIQRKATKSTMVYISYGDVEMLTAEDDDTPILRFTRGSIMNPCGGCAEVASAVSHVRIRAATFCTAHVLDTRDLWLVTAKFGKTSGQAFILRSAFEEHFDKVRRHYDNRSHPPVKHKSTILLLKRNLIYLKTASDARGKSLLDRCDMFLELAGCYVMRNQQNTSLTDESDAVCLQSTFPCILQPSSSLLIAWNIGVAILTCVVLFTHPYQFMYLKTVKIHFKFFDYFVTLIYIIDLVVSLSTGTHIEEGVPVTFAVTAAKQTTSIWFLIDLVAVLPIFNFVDRGQFAGLNKTIKIVKVFRLLKTFEDVFIHSSNLLRFLTYVLLMICMCYVIGASQQAFQCFKFDMCLVTNISTNPYWSKGALDDGPTLERLAYSWFWAISLLTFTAHKTSAMVNEKYMEQLMVMVLVEVLALTNIMIEATFSATVMVTTYMRDEYNTCIEVVTNFLTTSNVDAVLRYRFIEYLKLCWFTDKAYSITHDKNTIFYDLPPHVYQEIMAMQRNKYLLCIPCMKILNKSVLKQMCANSRMFYTSPNEILQNSGEICNEIYVIKQGMCELVNPITKQVANYISQKSHFGDVECVLRLPAFYTVRAVTHVQIVSIARKHLVKGINIPKMIDAIHFARQQPEYMQLQTRHSAFLKYEIAPHPPNREFFPLPRKHEPDTAFLLPFTRLGFFAVLRYIFPRFAIRPDGKYLQRWEWFRCACAITSAFIYPVYVILLLQFPFLFYFTWFLDATAYVDMFQRMLVAYYDENGILIYHPASTAAHYIKGSFTMDMLSCAPLEYLDSLRTVLYPYYGRGYRIPSTFQRFLYNRLGQLYRVPNALDFLNDYLERRDIIFLIKALPFFLSMLIIMTSLILDSTVDKIEFHNGGYELLILTSENASNWVVQYKSFVAYNITESGLNLILTCFYWVTYEVCTVGFDVLQPSNMTQLWTLLIGMLFGTMLMLYVAVTVLTIRANVNEVLASYQGHIKDMKTFMKREALDVELQKEFLSYYEYKWDKTCGIDYRTLLRLCDQITLRTDTILHIYGQTFTKCPLLYKCDISLCRILGRAVFSLYFKKDMTLIERNEVISDLYIVDYGTVELRASEDDSRIITKLPRGSMFGNLENEAYSVSRNKFVASSNLHLLKINSLTFYKVIADFPSVKVLLMKFRPNDENYIIGSLRNPSVVATTWKERSMSSPVLEFKQGSMQWLNVQGKAVQIYMMLFAMASVYADIYNAGFQDNSKICIGILYTLDAIFISKIILNFAQHLITDEESETKSVLVSARKAYFKGEFKYDLLSILPLEAFCLLNQNPWHFYAYLRLNRCLRMMTVYSGLERYHQKLSINLTVTTIAGFIIRFTLFIHTAGCVWWALGLYEEEKAMYSSWRYESNCKTDRTGTKVCTHTDLCYQGYICSVYYAMSTFTLNGIGDIMPKQQTEVLFTTVVMIVSTMLYMIFVGEFSNIIQYQSFRCFIFFSQYKELQNFLKMNRVSMNLVEMTKLYVLYLWRESRGYQIPQFLENAPQCLRLKVMSAAYMPHLLRHPTFKTCEPAFLRHLAGCFQPFLYVENMWVVKDAEITNAMYFVHRGRVQELDEEMDKKLQVYEAGSFFGTPHGLVRDFPYTHSYKTKIKSQVLTLAFDDWEYLLDNFPISKAIIYTSDNKEVEKKKKKITITKVPAGSSTDKKSDPKPKEPKNRKSFTFSGIPSGRDTPKSEPTKMKEAEPSWPMDNREQTVDEQEVINKNQPTGDEDDDDRMENLQSMFPKVKKRSVSKSDDTTHDKRDEALIPSTSPFASSTKDLETPFSEQEDIAKETIPTPNAYFDEHKQENITQLSQEDIKDKPELLVSIPSVTQSTESIRDKDMLDENRKPDAETEKLQSEEEKPTPTETILPLADDITLKYESKTEIATSVPVTETSKEEIKEELKMIKSSKEAIVQTHTLSLTKGTSTEGSLLPKRTSSAEELEMKTMTYSQSSLRKPQQKPDDLEEEGRIILPQGITLSRFDIENEEAVVEIPIAKSDQKIKLKIKVNASLTKIPDSPLKSAEASTQTVVEEREMSKRSPEHAAEGTEAKHADDIDNEGNTLLPQTDQSFNPTVPKDTDDTETIPMLPEDDKQTHNTSPTRSKNSVELLEEAESKLDPAQKQLLANMEPELLLKLAELKSKEKISVFKNEVTTVTLPEVASPVMGEDKTISEKAILPSVLTIIDDVALKDANAAVAPTTAVATTSAAAASTDAEYDEEKYPKGRKSPMRSRSAAGSIASPESRSGASSGPKSAGSTLDVEDFMLKIDEEKKQQKKKRKFWFRKSRKSREDDRHSRQKRKEDDAGSSTDVSDYL